MARMKPPKKDRIDLLEHMGKLLSADDLSGVVIISLNKIDDIPVLVFDGGLRLAEDLLLSGLFQIMEYRREGEDADYEDN